MNYLEISELKVTERKTPSGEWHWYVNCLQYKLKKLPWRPGYAMNANDFETMLAGRNPSFCIIKSDGARFLFDEFNESEDGTIEFTLR